MHKYFWFWFRKGLVLSPIPILLQKLQERDERKKQITPRTKSMHTQGRGKESLGKSVPLPLTATTSVSSLTSEPCQ